ncbi:Hpt domain-containing protein [Hyphomicrobium sp.]|jgi:HPt (histidine-containing phosphotransfer) domain-containing protein|uniref:Hpt domain-containing protein n=1 Tax=Hyphomicrobium sp. TaxID=82 RepID=UPI0035614C33
MIAHEAESFGSHTPDSSENARDMPLDLNHLRRYTLGDEALEAEVLGLFLAQLPETIASLRSAATERDWKIAAHALKGSSRAVGAWRIATLAQEAEALACGAEPEACSEAISRLEAAASEASDFVKEAAHRA